MMLPTGARNTALRLLAPTPSCQKTRPGASRGLAKAPRVVFAAQSGLGTLKA
jgi:hypothetical protein